MRMYLIVLVVRAVMLLVDRLMASKSARLCVVTERRVVALLRLSFRAFAGTSPSPTPKLSVGEWSRAPSMGESPSLSPPRA